MPQYKLIYYDIRGFGEGIRVLLHFGKLSFEDVRIEQEQWPEIKQSVPYGQLPVLEVDSQQIAQSAAIYRYLGRQLNLVPKCPLQEAMVDAAYDAYREFYGQISNYVLVVQGLSDGDKEQMFKEEFIPARDAYFTFVKADLAKSDGVHLIGKKLSWADIIIADSLLVLSSMIPSLFDGFPEVKKFVDYMHELPELKKYFEDRPPRPF